LWPAIGTSGTLKTIAPADAPRASVKVTLKADGNAMEPGQVVYCDRLQAVGVTPNTGLATDNISIELFFGYGSRVTGNSSLIRFRKSTP
jgi:hypothetical protein